VDESGRIKLPIEVIELFEHSTKLYLTLLKDRKLILIGNKDPEIMKNEAILNEMAELNRELSDEEYTRPVPESFLDKGGRK
jgi:hypothetical protein